MEGTRNVCLPMEEGTGRTRRLLFEWLTGTGIGNHIPPQQDTPQQWTHARILLMHYCHKRQVIIAAFRGGKYSRNTVHPGQLNRSNYEQNNDFKFHGKRINSSLPARSPFRF
ncbi:hypothetical protein FOXYSP1_07074 [Fusarium oxysporum f. sp. phaseoli]